MYRHSVKLYRYALYTAGIWNREFPLKPLKVKYNHIAATYHHTVVITAAGDIAVHGGGGIGKSLGWENVDLLATK